MNNSDTCVCGGQSNFKGRAPIQDKSGASSDYRLSRIEDAIGLIADLLRFLPMPTVDDNFTTAVQTHKRLTEIVEAMKATK